jgi:protein-L-isoaspartate(D-aspartate) O-methyltransferase
LIQINHLRNYQAPTLPDSAPFDAIHVGAAAASFPQALALQLKVGGVLIVPVGPQQGAQTLCKVEKISDKHPDHFDASDYRFQELLGVRYVPLIQEPPSS